MKSSLLLILALAALPAVALEPADVHGTWEIDLEESLERLLDQPQGEGLTRDEARAWIDQRIDARLQVTEQKIGIAIGHSKRFYTYKGVEVDVYKVIFRIEAGGRQGRMELTHKGTGGDLWVFTSTLTPYWNWSVWRKVDEQQKEERAHR